MKMPNWCNNTITLTHTDSSMIERAKKALQTGTFLDEFIPVPLEMLETEAWYGFRISNWGTKWDVGLDQGAIFRDKEHELGFTFCSAWSPPTAAYEKLSDFGFEIEATYYEPGMMFLDIGTIPQTITMILQAILNGSGIIFHASLTILRSSQRAWQIGKMRNAKNALRN